jgi:epoxyqueuosine reductase QueG
MDDGHFKERFDGTALLRPKASGMRRNALIALANHTGSVEPDPS